MRPGRIAGIDAARLALCYAVALIHLILKPTTAWQNYVLLACGAAVPFFLIAAGFFTSVAGHENVREVLRPSVRLIAIYVVWLTLYYALASLHDGALLLPAARNLLTGGLAYHLWFLPALAFSLAVIRAAVRLRLVRTAVVIAAAMGAISILSGAYGPALGLRPIPAMRLLTAPLFVIIGYIWSRSRWQPRVSTGLMLVVVSYAAVLLESSLIGKISPPNGAPERMSFSVYGYGAAVFALSLALPDSALIQRLGRIGALSLGIYAIHLAVILYLLPQSLHGPSPRLLIGGLLTILIGAAIARPVAAMPVIWRLVGSRIWPLRSKQQASSIQQCSHPITGAP